MSASTTNDHAELLRSDFVYFAAWCFTALHAGETYQHNWHMEAIAAALDKVRRGDNRRLLITMPPRHMKSLTVSVAWAAFLLGHDPALRIFLVSYGQELSQANLRHLRTILESDTYKAAFPKVKLTASTQDSLRTDNGGSVLAKSTSGAITGLGADYIIFDDPMKQADAMSVAERERVEAFYRGTILTRTNDPRTGRIIIVMQRIHEADLAAYVTLSGEYEVLNLPAVAEEPSEHALYYGGVKRRKPGDLLWPMRFPKEVLDSQRREMGDYEFSLQYQQNPIPIWGGLIRIDEIRRHEDAPDRKRCQMVIQSIDTGLTDSPKSDPSVIMTFGFCDGAWRLMDLQRRRLRYSDLLSLVRAKRSAWRADVVLVEHAVSGIPLVDDLWEEFLRARRGASYPTWTVRSYRPSCGKIERLAAQSAKLRDGFVTFPNDAPWMKDLLHEIASFPGGKNDDQVDALSQFIDYASRLGDPAEWGQRPTGRARPPGRPRRRLLR